jgi:hypothetical protein
MAKKKFDPKAKAKRQKMIAVVGGVLLIGVLAIQVPRTMKMMKSQDTTSSSSPPAATSTTAGSTALAPPTLDGSATSGTSGSAAAAGASAETSADGVSDPSNPLPPNAGQLVSFSKFKSKDPFHQQITDCGTTAGAGSAGSAGNCASTSTPGAARPASTKTPGSSILRSSPVSGSPSVLVKVNRATISVNGVPNAVSVGSSFPAAGPVFTLVSLKQGAAKIGIVGGSYENGAATVTLAKGKAVTLMNTADGTRYVLRLVAVA